MKQNKLLKSAFEDSTPRQPINVLYILHRDVSEHCCEYLKQGDRVTVDGKKAAVGVIS